MLKTYMPLEVANLVKSFEVSLKRCFNNNEIKRNFKECNMPNFYESAKKAETQERNLLKALKLYIEAINHGEKKDSSIKDFASSLHQLGYTLQAVRLMTDCEKYYHGNKDKYIRLKQNLEIQINPSGKHLCRCILIQNISNQIKNCLTDEDVKKYLFKCPKRIKKLKYLQNFELMNFSQPCLRQNAQNILLEFESFSAAKKTLQSFCFEEWFDSNLYWVNFQSLKIICSAFDGKKDFEEGFIVDNQLLEKCLQSSKETFWQSFGKKIYSTKDSNGYINLLATHLIKEHNLQGVFRQENKENIFERSKIINSHQR